MLRILCVCGNGMGTSTILKINVSTICQELGIEHHIESCSAGEATTFAMQTDLLITSPEWERMIMIPPHVKVATTLNLIDTVAMKELILKACKEHFPEELNK
ncbi:PTS ascorbate transporter subunit IIB [Clostridium sediminicola]|uniref:PTS sugar transporter subunit IIB n=1 Tax=Clostridium sediminicola TaxID=3114879 RepID=UPI0031F273AE